MMTMIMFIYCIAYGLNIVWLVRICTNTLPMPEKCSHGHPVKENDTTFEAYCRGEWELSKRHAYRLMDASLVVENLKSDQLVTPASESQARPLAQLPPEKQVEVDHE